MHRALNVDRSFGIVFESKVDSRETRPLLYPGRFLLPEHLKEHESIWRSSKLFLDGRTTPAVQIPGREMRIIEDLDPAALPGSYDDSITSTVQGAKSLNKSVMMQPSRP